MKIGEIPYYDSRIHFRQWGNGERLIIALHGFGEDGESFHPLSFHLPDKFSLVAIDLPFHGDSFWNEQRDFEARDLLSVIDRLRPESGAQPGNFILMGYSMGARIALSLYEYSPERVNQMILLSPDGLSIHFIYWFCTQTSLGNRLLKWNLEHPQSLLKLAGIIRSTGLVKERQLKFARLYLQDQETRNKVYEIWTGFKRFRPRHSRFKDLLRKYKTPLTLVYGKYDPVITPGKGVELTKVLGDQCNLKILECGHQLLRENQAFLICSLLLKGNQLNLRE